MVHELKNSTAISGQPIDHFEEGMRVELVADYEVYPTGQWKKGTRGTVTSVYPDDTPQRVHVLLDERDANLAEWRNVLQVCVDEDSGETYLHEIEDTSGEDDDANEYMRNGGWVVWPTGGGFTAWVKPGQEHIWISASPFGDDPGTHEGHPDAPIWSVSRNDDAGGYVQACGQQMTLARALALAAILPAPFPVGNQIDWEWFTDAQQIAFAFCALIHDDLDAAHLSEAIHRNRRETDKGVCHTHDFCDANMTMDAAFKAAMGRAIELGEETETSRADHLLWGEAWNIAKVAEFDAARITAESRSTVKTMRQIIGGTQWIAIERWTESDTEGLGKADFLDMREDSGCGAQCAAVILAAETLCKAVTTAYGDADKAIQMRGQIADAAERVVNCFYYS